jgi:hypothetical protein
MSDGWPPADRPEPVTIRVADPSGGYVDERTLTARFKSWADEAIAGGAFRPIDSADTETHPGNDLLLAA